ncbi:MAG: hypothetical protein HY302_01735 [Opitutae bacterium]|nr:hypothetical protein [Opitutae bacterium]
MTNQDADGLFENDWDDRSELSWTETDWERYLAEQEEAVRQYLKHYDQLAGSADRIDEAARRMGWEMADAAPAGADGASEADDDEAFDESWEPYTLHRNPVFVATRALYASLLARWERVAAEPERVPAAAGLAVQASLYRGSELALHAIQSLEMGDYTLALCFFKRALRELNTTLARLNEPETAASPALAHFGAFALPRLFDLREIWLRVMHECRSAEDE